MTLLDRKRVQHAGASPSTPASNPSLIEVIARLRSQLAHVDQLSSAETSPADLKRELSVLEERMRVYEATAAIAVHDGSAEASLLTGGWRDELDQKGTQLWNRSTALKHAFLDGQSDQPWLETVAVLRFIAYRLIRSGAVDPLSSKDRLAYLSLCTKAAAALLAADQIPRAEQLMLECAKLVSALEQDGPPTGEATKRLVEYFCFRMRFSLATSKISLVSWAVKQAQTLLQTSSTISWRHIECLVQTILHVSSVLVVQADLEQPRADDELANELAREWLQWLLELLEAAEGQDVRALQVATLRLFAQACLATKSSSELHLKAEAALHQLLDIEPSPALYRRLVKLVIARNGSDVEIAEVFLPAAKASAYGGRDASLLLATLEGLPVARKSLRMQLFNQIVANLATSGIVHCNLLEQVVVAAVMVASEAEQIALTKLLGAVEIGMPAFTLPPAEAFTCVMFLRRTGDNIANEKRHAVAADWFLLATSTAFRALPWTTTAKSFRKAALSYLEAGQPDRAEEVMLRVPGGEEEAKDHFIRFCCHKDNTSKALATLKSMVTATAFSPKLLQWAYKVAVEHDCKDLPIAITELLFEVCQAPEAALQVDYMVLTRSVIRQQIVRLQDKSNSDGQRDEIARGTSKQLESGLLLARRLSDSENPPKSLVKEIAWLYKTSFNLCADFCGQWSASTSTRFFEITASLIELAAQLDGESIDLNKLWTCKLAIVSGHYAMAKETVGQNKMALKGFVKEVEEFLESLALTLASSEQLEKAEQLIEVGYAAKVDALSHLEAWSALVEVVEAFEDRPEAAPLGVIKLIVDLVTKSTTCPLDQVCIVLRKTLAILYGRQNLDVESMASWLRMLVYALVNRREVDQALEYVQNARHFIEQHKDEYPEDEANWMLSTAWDEGLNAFAASKPLAGAAWCETSLGIARTIQSPLLQTVEGQMEHLKARYAVKADDDGDVVLE